MTDDRDDAALLHLAADLLYDAGDPRSTPWPDPATLGRLRSRLRNVALGLHPHCDDPAECRQVER
jgi:hypothetical protein